MTNFIETSSSSALGKQLKDGSVEKGPVSGAKPEPTGPLVRVMYRTVRGLIVKEPLMEGTGQNKKRTLLSNWSNKERKCTLSILGNVAGFNGPNGYSVQCMPTEGVSTPACAR